MAGVDRCRWVCRCRLDGWRVGPLNQTQRSNARGLRYSLSAMRYFKGYIVLPANRHEALRAVAAVYVGRFGDLVRRKALISIYSTVSSYIQAAIYFSSRTWPAVERANAKASWGGHTQLNALLALALATK